MSGGKKKGLRKAKHTFCAQYIFLLSHTVYEKNTPEIMYRNCYPKYIL